MNKWSHGQHGAVVGTEATDSRTEVFFVKRHCKVRVVLDQLMNGLVNAFEQGDSSVILIVLLGINLTGIEKTDLNNKKSNYDFHYKFLETVS